MRIHPLLSSRLAPALAAVVVAIVLLLVPVAGATQFRGSIDDAPEAALPGGVDILRAEALYDDADGTVSLTVTLREAPGAPAFVVTGFGTRDTAGRCERPGVNILGGADGPALMWRRAGSDATGAAQRAQGGAVVTYSATDAALVGQGYNCVSVVSLRDSAGSESGEQLGAFDLKAVALTPPVRQDPPDRGGSRVPSDPTDPPSDTPGDTTPPAGTSPTAENPGPMGARTTDRPASPSVAKKPALRVALTGRATRTLRRGRWATVKVRIANTGTALARTTRLKVRATKGVSVRVAGATRRHPGVRALTTLRAGRSRDVTVRLRASRAGKVTFLASAAGTPNARATVVVKLAAR